MLGEKVSCFCTGQISHGSSHDGVASPAGLLLEDEQLLQVLHLLRGAPERIGVDASILWVQPLLLEELLEQLLKDSLEDILELLQRLEIELKLEICNNDTLTTRLRWPCFES